MYQNCHLCPRNCSINRNKEKGICQNTSKVKVARSALYFYEEPSISGFNGSGAIFFSGCNLKCCYCQNKEISLNNFGKEITIERLSDLMLDLQEKKAHNINLVTPTHFIPSIIEAIKIARKKGLHIPIVYNTSGYESVKSLKLLEDYIDIYLTDFRYFNNTLAENLSKCSNYVEIVKEALKEMYRQTGKNEFDENGLMTKGIIVRCLILPTKSYDTKRVISYLHQTYHDNIYLSIMNQYTKIEENTTYKFLNKKVSNKEYQSVLEYALNIGVTNAYIQEDNTASKKYIPDFDLTGL